MDTDLTARAAFIADLANRAAALAKDGFERRNHGDFELKGPQDFLTETDLAVEEMVRHEISAAFPEDGILGEEGGGVAQSRLWIIDPVDGTANFARGIPHFCVCLCFCHDAQPVLAAIAQPMTGELWFAHAGQGAFKNGAAITVAQTGGPEAASFEMGWTRRLPIERYFDVQRQLLQAGAVIRRGGSGALGLAWVAEGRTDGYLEAWMHPWDCLAGMLLVREAGGVTGPMPSGLDDIAPPRPVHAATPGLASLLEQGLQWACVTDPDLGGTPSDGLEKN